MLYYAKALSVRTSRGRPMRIQRSTVVHPRFVLYGLLAASLLIPLKTTAQSYNLRFEVVLNNGTYYDLKVQISGSAAFSWAPSR